MLTKILEWLRGVIDKMLSKNSVQQALQIDIDVSTPMLEALETWVRMYENDAEWLGNYVKSLNLPAAISGEIARSATIEMEVEITGGSRATFLATQLVKVTDMLRELIEYGVAKGGIMFKPYVDGENIAVDFVQADQFYPVSFDANGGIIACVFSDQRKVGQYFYTRLEYHSLLETGYEVRNAAFRSDNGTTLGMSVPLDTVPAWKDLAEEATITNVDKPLFSYFRFPLANNIDTQSPLGVSGYSRAVDLIKQADILWSDLVWEFESGKRALYVDDQAFDQDSDHKPVLPDKRLYRPLHSTGSIGAGNELYKEWSPAFREASILNGLDAILKKIEFNCGLAYGTLSDPQTVDKTATEILSSKQRFAVTITDTQKVIERTLNQLLYAMDIWASLENLAAKGAYEAAYEFDDSVVTDHQAQFTQDNQTVGMGAMSKKEFLIRNYGLTEALALQWIAEAKGDMQEQLSFEGDRQNG